MSDPIKEAGAELAVSDAPSTVTIPQDLAGLLNPEQPVERGIDQSAKVPDASKVEAPAKVEAPVADDKPLTSAEIIEQSLRDTQAPVVPEVANAKPTRDFTGIDPTDQDLFKNMSTQAMAKLKPMYLEHKQLKTDMAKLRQEKEDLAVKANAANEYKTILDHDQGYLLTPEFARAAQVVQNLEYEENFWAVQLEKIECGDKFSLLGRDANGNYTTLDAKQASTADKIAVQRKLAQAMQYKSAATGELSAFQMKHNARRAEVNQALRGASDQFMPFYKGLESNKAHPHHKFYNEAVERVAPELRAHPLVDFCAKQYAMIAVQQEMINNMKKASGFKQDAASGGPNGSVENVTTTTTKPTAIEPPDWNSVEKYMQGGAHPLGV